MGEPHWKAEATQRFPTAPQGPRPPAPHHPPGYELRVGTGLGWHLPGDGGISEPRWRSCRSLVGVTHRHPSGKKNTPGKRADGEGEGTQKNPQQSPKRPPRGGPRGCPGPPAGLRAGGTQPLTPRPRCLRPWPGLGGGRPAVRPSVRPSICPSDCPAAGREVGAAVRKAEPGGGQAERG